MGNKTTILQKGKELNSKRFEGKIHEHIFFFFLTESIYHLLISRIIQKILKQENNGQRICIEIS